MPKLGQQVAEIEAELKSVKADGSDGTLSRLSQLCHTASRAADELSQPEKARSSQLLKRLRRCLEEVGRLQKKSRDSLDFNEAVVPEENPFAEKNVLAAVKAQEEATLRLMDEREREMNRLAGDIVMLEEMFKNLGDIVNEQGERVDLLEENVGQAEVEVVSGCEKLEEAVANKKSARKKKIMLIVIAVVAGFLLILTLIILGKIYF